MIRLLGEHFAEGAEWGNAQRDARGQAGLTQKNSQNRSEMRFRIRETKSAFHKDSWGSRMVRVRIRQEDAGRNNS